MVIVHVHGDDSTMLVHGDVHHGDDSASGLPCVYMVMIVPRVEAMRHFQASAMHWLRMIRCG